MTALVMPLDADAAAEWEAEEPTRADPVACLPMLDMRETDEAERTIEEARRHAA